MHQADWLTVCTVLMAEACPYLYEPHHPSSLYLRRKVREVHSYSRLWSIIPGSGCRKGAHL